MSKVLEASRQDSTAIAGPFIDDNASLVGKQIAPPTTKLPFNSISTLLAGAPAPRRPVRSKPLHLEEALSEELRAWDAASDEVWETE